MSTEKASSENENQPSCLGAVSGSLLNDWQKWEDCILSFLRTYPKVREDFNKHVDDWNTHTPLPPSAYERGEQ
jgi:hypothetical protein